MKFLICGGLLILFIFHGCSTLTLKPADFSWPVESVLEVDENGSVQEERYSISFNTKNLFFEETEDSNAYLNKEIRLIRNAKGFYFMTSNKFKNVYVFNVYDGELYLENKIFISETGINKPALNQRQSYIQLYENGNQYLLSNDGIIKEEENEE